MNKVTYSPAVRTMTYAYVATVALSSQQLRPAVVEQVCQNRSMRAFVKRGLTVQHSYQMPKEQQLVVGVTELDC